LIYFYHLEYISKMTSSIFENNEIEALEVIDSVISDGKDLTNFLWEVIKYIKDILVYKSTGKANLYSEDEIAEIKRIAELASRQRILNIIYLLSDLENEIKWSSQKTVMFQTGIIKACMGIQNDGIEELKTKIEILEEKIKNGNIVVNNSNIVNSNVPKSTVVKKLVESKSESSIKDVPKESTIMESSTIESTSVNWQNIINTLRTTGKVRLYTSLANTKINQVGDLILEIEFPNGLTPFVKSILEDSSNKKDLTDILFKETGKEWHIKYKDRKSSKPKSSNNSNPIDDLGININVIE